MLVIAIELELVLITTLVLTGVDSILVVAALTTKEVAIVVLSVGDCCCWLLFEL